MKLHGSFMYNFSMNSKRESFGIQEKRDGWQAATLF